MQKIVKALDEQGLNASDTVGHMLDIRAVVEQRVKTGKAPLKDGCEGFNRRAESGGCG